MSAVDLDEHSFRNKLYGGANGTKKQILFGDELYMLKFEPIDESGNEPYHTCVSEHLGSTIFRMIGMDAQETFLASKTIDGRRRHAVACKDFEGIGTRSFKEFAKARSGYESTSSQSGDAELDDVLELIQNQSLVPSEQLEEFFWNMFIIDAFIGNGDRHTGNWGFIYDALTDTNTIAPVFDCGSSLMAKGTESAMRFGMTPEGEQKLLKNPSSAIKKNGRDIVFQDFIMAGENERCTEALERIAPRIDLEKIVELIDNVPDDFITDLERAFLKYALELRYEKMIKEPYEKLLGKELVPLKGATALTVALPTNAGQVLDIDEPAVVRSISQDRPNASER